MTVALTDDVTTSLDSVMDATTDDVAAFSDDVMTQAERGVMPATTYDVIHNFVTPDPAGDLIPSTAFTEESLGEVTDRDDVVSDDVTTETPVTLDAGDVTASATDDVTRNTMASSVDDVTAAPSAGDVIARAANDVIDGNIAAVAPPAHPVPDALSASGSAEAPPSPLVFPGRAPPAKLEAETSQSEEETMTSLRPPQQQEVANATSSLAPPPLPVTSPPLPLPLRPEVEPKSPPPPPRAPPPFRFSFLNPGVTPRSTPPLPPAPATRPTLPFRPPRIHAHLGPPAPPASRGHHHAVSRDPVWSMTSSLVTSHGNRPQVHVRRGSRLRLRCEAMGDLAPRVVWQLPWQSRDPRVSVAPDGSLSVAPVTELDAGDYVCLVGGASAAFTVHVLAGPDPAPSAALASGRRHVAMRLAVTTDPPWRAADATIPVVSARVGSSVRLSCRGGAGTTTKSPVTWQLPDGTWVTSFSPATSSPPRARVDPRGWLALWPLAPGDAGLYRCWAPGGGVARAVVVRVD
ncbi:nascent polypeptide-associated complex subunit alpha, muscle-specific form-like [Arvicola amphibius]|uniref:nascent polypeptide-associated complex subunit alpha, muscle-specific form-like n=1 Tax=Arvicola amphibius TaxID=1047088 RepID=UPI001C09F530|nr:nascent polypeptide-associated complex subunit alpha, muscle-specific form-like [Arvicola amphibius]